MTLTAASGGFISFAVDGDDTPFRTHIRLEDVRAITAWTKGD